MPKGTIYSLRKCELGRESTKGTAVAGSQIILGRAEIQPEFELGRTEDTPIGIMVANVDSTPVIKKAVNARVIMPHATYEQIDWMFGLSIDQPVTTGAGPYVHTFDPGIAAIWNPHSATLRGRWTDGVTPEDLRCQYFTGSRLRLSLDESGILQAELEGFARDMVDEALTGAALPATLTKILGAHCKVHFNDTLAAADTDTPANPVPLQMKSLNLDVDVGQFPEWNMEQSLLFGEAKERVKNFALGMTLRYDATAASENAAAERVHALATDLRFVTLMFTGPGNLKLRVVLAGKHEKGEIGPPTAQSDGLDTVDYNIVGHHDATGAKLIKVVLTNDDTTAM
jgi:hypothetical protein